MRGLHIDSINQCIEPLELPESPGMFEKFIKARLKCAQYTVSVARSKALLIIVDEKCLVNAQNIAFKFPFMEIPFFGDAILLGHNEQTKDAESLDLAINKWTLTVHFFSRGETEIYRSVAQQLQRKVSKNN